VQASPHCPARDPAWAGLFRTARGGEVVVDWASGAACVVSLARPRVPASAKPRPVGWHLQDEYAEITPSPCSRIRLCRPLAPWRGGDTGQIGAGRPCRARVPMRPHPVARRFPPLLDAASCSSAVVALSVPFVHPILGPAVAALLVRCFNPAAPAAGPGPPLPFLMRAFRKALVTGQSCWRGVEWLGSGE
jgi:hypothetical protein